MEKEEKMKLRLCYSVSVTFCHQHQFSSFPFSHFIEFTRLDGGEVTEKMNLIPMT